VVPFRTVFFQEPSKSFDIFFSSNPKFIGKASRISQNFITFALVLAMGDLFFGAVFLMPLFSVPC